MIIINVTSDENIYKDVFITLLKSHFDHDTLSKSYIIDPKILLNQFLYNLSEEYNLLFEYLNIDLTQYNNYEKFVQFVLSFNNRIDLEIQLIHNLYHNKEILIMDLNDADFIDRLFDTNNICYTIELTTNKTKIGYLEADIEVLLTNNFDENFSSFNNIISVFLLDLLKKGLIVKNESNFNNLYGYSND